MRLVLVSYFDLGHSLGLDDTAFPDEVRAAEPDLGLVGIANPLGGGLAVELVDRSPDVIDAWRAEALRQAQRPEMDLGWTPEIPMDDFDARLAALLGSHPLTSCRLTVYGIGIVGVWLQFGEGIPVRYLQAVNRCFEFAAYRPGISHALHAAARHRVAEVLGSRPTRLATLTRREAPKEQRDARGYTESRRFTSFTEVVLCVDDGDDQLLPEILQVVHLAQAPVVEFEYHGRLHYDWAACVLEPRELHGWQSPDASLREPPAQQIVRMCTCIEIAHAFLGACVAFDQLFRAEIHTQVGGYIGKTAGHRPRGPDDLNRLRTLALAVVNLTNFDLVTDTAEDREYFRLFAADSRVAELRSSVQETCEVLYNVQTAEQDRTNTRRQNALNLIALALAIFALLAAMESVYNFLGGTQPLIRDRHARWVLLDEILASLALVVAITALYFGRPRRRGR